MHMQALGSCRMVQISRFYRVSCFLCAIAWPLAQNQLSMLATAAASTPHSTGTTGTPAAEGSSRGQTNPCCARIGALNFSSNIPVVVVELQSLDQVSGLTAADAKLLAKGPDLPATLCTCGAPDGLDVPSIPAKIKIRGSSSAVEYAKKSFALKTLDQSKNLSSSTGEDIRLLGFPADSSWVLHGPENDRTLGMRNWLAYWMARQMGRYASRTMYYEMFLNTDPGSPLSLQHYWGVYQLQEKVSRGKHRVDVQKFDPATDLSGGYIMSYENDNTAVKDVLIQLKLSQLVMIIDYPSKADQNTLMWITQWMNTLESDLLSQPLSNLSSVLDVPAAMDYFIGTEVTKNPDGYRGSIKMHKDRGGPLVMGPMWDYNEAFGMCCGYPIEGYQAGGRSNGSSGGSAVSAAGWRFNICQDKGRCRVEPGDGVSQWYRKLWMDSTFRTSTAARWSDLRKAGGPLTDEMYMQEINKLKELLSQGPAARNYQRWSGALNNPTYGPAYPNWQAMFDDEVKILQDWTLARLKWLDAAFAKEASASAAPDAYMSLGYIVAEPELAGADDMTMTGAGGAAGAGGGTPGPTQAAVASG